MDRVMINTWSSIFLVVLFIGGRVWGMGSPVLCIWRWSGFGARIFSLNLEVGLDFLLDEEGKASRKSAQSPGCIHGVDSPTTALLWNLASYLQSATTRQHRREQPWPGPTRACTHFTYFNKTAITKKLSHLWS